MMYKITDKSLKNNIYFNICKIKILCNNHLRTCVFMKTISQMNIFTHKIVKKNGLKIFKAQSKVSSSSVSVVLIECPKLCSSKKSKINYLILSFIVIKLTAESYKTIVFLYPELLYFIISIPITMTHRADILQFKKKKQSLIKHADFNTFGYSKYQMFDYC